MSAARARRPGGRMRVPGWRWSPPRPRSRRREAPARDARLCPFEPAMRVRHLVPDGKIERARALARRAARDTLIGAAGGVELAVEAGGPPPPSPAVGGPPRSPPPAAPGPRPAARAGIAPPP